MKDPKQFETMYLWIALQSKQAGLNGKMYISTTYILRPFDIPLRKGVIHNEERNR